MNELFVFAGYLGVFLMGFWIIGFPAGAVITEEGEGNAAEEVRKKMTVQLSLLSWQQ